MPKLLTRLKISEVSAVDRGAGEDCRILLCKRDQDVTKATAALKESVSSILGCDEDDEVKRAALVETFGQFESYLDRNVAGGKALSKGPLERAERARREKFEKIFGARPTMTTASCLPRRAATTVPAIMVSPRPSLSTRSTAWIAFASGTVSKRHTQRSPLWTIRN